MVVASMLIPGTEHTYKTAAYFLYHLAQNPDKQVNFFPYRPSCTAHTPTYATLLYIQEILYKEIERKVGGGPLDGSRYIRLTSSYLAAALKESQRLQPAAGQYCI